MGLLTVGSPLDWYETKPIVDYIKDQGILQFINVYHKLKDRQDLCFKWGDEIEYMIVKFDHANKKVRLSLRGEEVLNHLMSREHEDPTKNEFLWRPEFGGFMIEGSPGQPFNGNFDCFSKVEENMRRRRQDASIFLEPDEVLLSLSNFPRLGCPDFTWPSYLPKPNSSVLHSLFFPDEAVHNDHPRFLNISRNVRQRRGENPNINVPIFRDENTPKPFVEDFKSMGDDGQAVRNAKSEHIYMDSIGFGSGCCCLQVTFQAVNINEARWLYDQLTPLTPVLLAISAATPIFRGFLADIDSRWNIISASIDDRTREERGLQPLKENKFVIPKSRYDTTDCYLCSCNSVYNDIPLQYEQKYFDLLQKSGVDDLLAQHIAHLFIRDPLQVYSERINQNDQESSEHFETIQSSNWMNMRFKPPPLDEPEIGWRVEFRPIEVQLTDFENAAYACFVMLLTRVIISFGLTCLLPISKVNENMERAQKRDAVLMEKFHFRRSLTNRDKILNETSQDNSDGDCVEMTINEIMNGNGSDFPGLINMIHKFLDSSDIDFDTRFIIEKYIKFIQCRSNGTIWTLAHWQRQFVCHHKSYKKDSVVSDEISYDMLKKMSDISQGRAHCHSLLGNFRQMKSSLGAVDEADFGIID